MHTRTQTRASNDSQGRRGTRAAADGAGGGSSSQQKSMLDGAKSGPDSVSSAGRGEKPRWWLIWVYLSVLAVRMLWQFVVSWRLW